MVYRVFVEKKKELAFEANALLSDARALLGIENLTNVRLLNRYDAENITEELFEYAKKTMWEYALNEKENIILSDYIYNMPIVMAAADIVICRAGAMTLSELAWMKKASRGSTSSLREIAFDTKAFCSYVLFGFRLSA